MCFPLTVLSLSVAVTVEVVHNANFSKLEQKYKTEINLNLDKYFIFVMVILLQSYDVMSKMWNQNILYGQAAVYLNQRITDVKNKSWRNLTSGNVLQYTKTQKECYSKTIDIK